MVRDYLIPNVSQENYPMQSYQIHKRVKTSEWTGRCIGLSERVSGIRESVSCENGI